jgi:hypothetical protein
MSAQANHKIDKERRRGNWAGGGEGLYTYFWDGFDLGTATEMGKSNWDTVVKRVICERGALTR